LPFPFGKGSKAALEGAPREHRGSTGEHGGARGSTGEHRGSREAQQGSKFSFLCRKGHRIKGA